jgi:protein-S-isoprenylcysteine O-methyltransferase Ste14
MLGFAIMMWGWWLFKIHATAVCPTVASKQLVTEGIYRVTRNPMYLGLIMMLLAIALGVGTLPFYLVTVVYFFIINNVFCPYEEHKLTQAFGERYSLYRDRVRRWL